MKMKYFAGWDGGATHTTIECVNPAGETVLRAKAGPLNAHGSTHEQVARTVKEALLHMETLPDGLSALGGLCIGGAGASGAGTRGVWEDALASGGLNIPYTLVSDYETALFGAFNGGPGIVLISGTGAVCSGKDNSGRIHRCGGWGHIFDDEGSGYAIGRDVLGAVVRSYDGRAKPTVLKEMLFDAWGIQSIPELVTRAYSRETGKKEIAALTVLFDKALALGDDAAIEILHKAVSSLIVLLTSTLKSLEFTEDMVGTVLMGGIVRKEAAIYFELKKRLPTRLRLCEPLADAARGAALMALGRY